MPLKLHLGELLGERIRGHQSGTDMFEQVPDELVKQLDLQDAPLGRGDMEILLRDLVLGVCRLTAVDTRKPEQTLRESLLHNLERALTVDVDDTFHVRAEECGNRLPNREKIRHAEMQSLQRRVSRTGRSELSGCTPPLDQHPGPRRSS